MNVLIPMAGSGSRFKEGYKTSKPLILVNQKPMVVEVNQPPSEGKKYIYICRRKNIEKDHIDKEIKKHYLDAKFIVINDLTEGQASTCLFAKHEINNNEELIIGACDNGMIWEKKKFLTEKRSRLLSMVFQKKCYSSQQARSLRMGG